MVLILVEKLVCSFFFLVSVPGSPWAVGRRRKSTISHILLYGGPLPGVDTIFDETFQVANFVVRYRYVSSRKPPVKVTALGRLTFEGALIYPFIGDTAGLGRKPNGARYGVVFR